MASANEYKTGTLTLESKVKKIVIELHSLDFNLVTNPFMVDEIIARRMHNKRINEELRLRDSIEFDGCVVKTYTKDSKGRWRKDKSSGDEAARRQPKW